MTDLRKMVSCIVLVLAAAVLAFAQAPVAFNDRFDGNSLRFDLYQVGSAREESIVIDHIYGEGAWPESPAGPIEPFENGRYRVRVYDVASNLLIYSRGFDAMFGEYKTTTPGIEGVQQVYKRSLRIPAPKAPFLLLIEVRDKMNVPHALLQREIDPADYHIIRENPAAGDFIYEPLVNGDPKEKVDLLFIAEGYTAAERDKFKADVDRMMGTLFSVEPYKGRKTDFNVRGVFRPSAESAMDEPRQRRYRKTSLNASFNAFGTDRYMLIEEGHMMREMAGQVPYDAIVVLVNSKRYGGGGIYNDYCVTTVDNDRSRQVLVHEFGHSFAGLADEYYSSDVSYNEFYAKGVEPLEPNITALLDTSYVKWAALLSPGIGIPTEYGKDEMDRLQAEKRELMQKMMPPPGTPRPAKTANVPPVKQDDKELKARLAALDKKIAENKEKYAGLSDKVGVFEGAGYASKGLYRPMMDCLMITNNKLAFCAVCRQTISRMIDYYTGK